MVLIAWLFACGPKAAPIAAAEPTPIDLVLVAEEPGDSPPRDVPPRAASRIGQVAAEYNLIPRAVDAGTWSEAFAARETAEQRVAWAREQPGAAPNVLVISVVPTYFGFVAGRYRWTVSVASTLQAAGAPEQAERFEVPVLLTWDHEREDAAIDAALPLIEREVADQIEGWLRARQ
jgi:hypothetical protein